MLDNHKIVRNVLQWKPQNLKILKFQKILLLSLIFYFFTIPAPQNGVFTPITIKQFNSESAPILVNDPKLAMMVREGENVHKFDMIEQSKSFPLDYPTINASSDNINMPIPTEDRKSVV